jgi:RNA polymerase sigma factor CnrH
VRADAAHVRNGRSDQGAAATRVASLFEAHGRMVYGLCLLLLRDAIDAEDAAQQTFVSAYGALLRGSVVRDPPAWLAAAARNECRARLRRREREPVSLHQATLELLSSSEHEATHVLEAAAVRDALAELPLRQREAVVLRDVLGFRTREVGAVLGLSRPAVEALVFRARRRLRVRLRAAATVLVVPVALREGLAQALPDAAAPVGVAVGGGVLAKVSAPLVAKVAVGLAAAGVAGASAVEVERGLRQRPAAKPAVAAASPTRRIQAAPKLPASAAEQEIVAHGVARPRVRAGRDEQEPAHREHRSRRSRRDHRASAPTARRDSSGPGGGDDDAVRVAAPIAASDEPNRTEERVAVTTGSSGPGGTGRSGPSATSGATGEGDHSGSSSGPGPGTEVDHESGSSSGPAPAPEPIGETVVAEESTTFDVDHSGSSSDPGSGEAELPEGDDGGGGSSGPDGSSGSAGSDSGGPG